MFCTKCGKPIAEGTAFCSKCGEKISEQSRMEQPIQMSPKYQRNERAIYERTAWDISGNADLKMGIKKNNSGTKRGKNAIVVITAMLAAIAVIFSTIIIVKPASKDRTTSFLYVTDEGELMYMEKMDGKTEPVLVTDELQTPEQVEAKTGIAMYDDFSLTRDGKRIYYIGDNGALYSITVNALKKGERPERIGKDVSQYILTSNGNMVYWTHREEESRYYLFDGKESTCLYKGGTSYVVGPYIINNGNQDYAFFWDVGSSHNLYQAVLEPGVTAELLAEDVSTLLNTGEALYIAVEADGQDRAKNYTMYSYTPGEMPVVLIESTEPDIQSFWESPSYYFVHTDEIEWSIRDCFSDKYLAQDAANPESNEARERNYIREQLPDERFIARIGELYYFDGKSSNLIGSNVCLNEYSLLDDEYGTSSKLLYNAQGADGVHVYQKLEEIPTPICDISDLAGESIPFDSEVDFWRYVGGFMLSDGWYSNVNGVENELSLNGTELLGIVHDQSIIGPAMAYTGSVMVLNNNEVVLQVMSTKEGTTQALYSFSIKNHALTFDSVIFESETDFDAFLVDKNGKDVIYIASDPFYEEGKDVPMVDWSIYSDGKVTTIAQEVFPYIIPDSEIEIVGTEEGEITLLSNGKRIGSFESGSNFALLDKDRMLYISDGDLYLWDGRTSKLLARDVVEIAPNYAKRNMLAPVWRL